MFQRMHRVLALSGGLILSVAALSACGGQMMMATPVMFEGARVDPFSKFTEAQRTNEVGIFYATNRPAQGEKGNRRYGNGVSDDLSLGELTVRLGPEGMSWDELYEASTTAKRKRSVTLNLSNTRELAVLRAHDSPISPPAGVRGFADRINDALADKRWKDITIYIHGANVDFKQTACTAGEFHHFMGRHGVMITFDWPSTQSVITYGTDVKRAAASVIWLADFIEFLAANTNARKINLIGYSAGAQVLSPALYELRNRYAGLGEKEIEEKLRIGEVYFAAPDIGLRTFVLTHVPRYYDMAVSTTLTMNLKDSVLSMAQMSHGESRAGRPDIRELNEEESLMVAGLLELPSFNVIDMGSSRPPTEANLRGHGYWYKSPWVSTDIITQFIFHASPAQRGLEIDDDVARKVEVWYYPSDYPDRVVSRIKAYLASLEEEDVVQDAMGRPASP